MQRRQFLAATPLVAAPGFLLEKPQAEQVREVLVFEDDPRSILDILYRLKERLPNNPISVIERYDRENGLFAGYSIKTADTLRWVAAFYPWNLKPHPLRDKFLTAQGRMELLLEVLYAEDVPCWYKQPNDKTREYVDRYSYDDCLWVAHAILSNENPPAHQRDAALRLASYWWDHGYDVHSYHSTAVPDTWPTLADRLKYWGEHCNVVNS